MDFYSKFSKFYSKFLISQQIFVSSTKFGYSNFSKFVEISSATNVRNGKTHFC